MMAWEDAKEAASIFAILLGAIGTVLVGFWQYGRVRPRQDSTEGHALMHILDNDLVFRSKLLDTIANLTKVVTEQGERLKATEEHAARCDRELARITVLLENCLANHGPA